MPHALNDLRITVDDLGMFPEIEKSVSTLSAYGMPLYGSWLTNYGAPSKDVLSGKHGIHHGLHFNLLEGAAKITNPTITDQNGQFNRRWAEFVVPMRRMRIAVEEQLAHQISVALEWFGSLSHIDSHLHIHSIPWIYKLMRATQKKHGIEHLRNPYEPVKDLGRPLPKLLLLEAFRIVNRPEALPCFGISSTFTMDAAKCVQILKNGPRELIWHTSLGMPNFNGTPQSMSLSTNQWRLRCIEHYALEALLKELSHDVN